MPLSKRSFALPLLGLILAAGCLGTALPVARNALARLPGDPLRARVQGFEPLAPADEAMFLESRRAGTAADHRDLGRMFLAGPVAGAPEQPHRLSQAIAELEHALAKAPADGFAWADLSLARLRRDGPTPAGLAALRLSVAMAPGEPALAAWRTGMLLRHEALFVAEDHQLLTGQIATAWSYQPQSILRLLEAEARIELLRAALATAPADQAKLDALLAKRR